MGDEELDVIEVFLREVEDELKQVNAERARGKVGQASLRQAQGTAVREAPLRQAQGAGEEGGFRSTTWEDLKVFIDPIEWDWAGWLPRGFLTVLAAEPGMGKSLLCLRMAACYLLGWDLPDGRPFGGRRERVVWCEGEASQALNLTRAVEWGLPLGDIVSPLAHPMEGFRLDDERHVTALLHVCRKPETGLVVMDSLSSLVVGGPRGSGGSNAVVEGIPRVLRQLGEIARISGRPILLTHHLRKRTTLDALRQAQGPLAGVDLQRLRGTSKIGQMARVVWMLDAPNFGGPDKEDEGNRRLVVVKNNLMSPPEPVGMRVAAGRPVFGEAPEPVLVDESTSLVEVGVRFLAGLLAEGPKRAVEVEAAFLEMGISKMTMRRAKKALGVVSFKGVGEKGWWWKIGGEE